MLVVNKAPGLLSQGDISGDPNLLDMGKIYIKEKYDKPGNVFLGLVHRLDRPTSGVMVFARTSKAASRLSRYFRKHRINKTYLALVEGKPPEEGTYSDYIRRDKIAGFVTGDSRDQSAELHFRRRKTQEDVSLMEIDLLTGRHHQIRIRFLHHGHCVFGDRRCGSRRDWSSDGIAFHPWKLTILHPVSPKKMIFTASPPDTWTPFI